MEALLLYFPKSSCNWWKQGSDGFLIHIIVLNGLLFSFFFSCLLVRSHGRHDPFWGGCHLFLIMQLKSVLCRNLHAPLGIQFPKQTAEAVDFYFKTISKEVVKRLTATCYLNCGTHRNDPRQVRSVNTHKHMHIWEQFRGSDWQNLHVLTWLREYQTLGSGQYCLMLTNQKAAVLSKN